MPPTLILVRHGESVANAEHLAGLNARGPTDDVPLTSRGILQAKLTAMRIRHIAGPNVHVVVSPFTRAQQTAAPLAWGATVDAILREYERESETWPDFVARCRDVLGGLLTTTGTRIVYTHSQVIATLLELLIRGVGPLGPGNCFFQTPNCGVTILMKLPGDAGREHWRVVTHASVAHLPSGLVSGSHGDAPTLIGGSYSLEASRLKDDLHIPRFQ